MNESLGIAHFLAQADWVARSVLSILIAMSIACWYLIALKTWQHIQQNHLSTTFLQRNLGMGSIDALRKTLAAQAPNEAFARLGAQALACCLRIQHKSGRTAFDLAQPENLVAATLRQSIAEEMAQRETGLSLLASVGSTSPFVGLFGTVWGIYHALIAISQSGQAGLDKMAGPVGEALIMTACGLAVAIPAVLAYNAFVRINRRVQDALEAWANEVFTLLATDSSLIALDGPASATAQRMPRRA